jgi:hypothetical protein
MSAMKNVVLPPSGPVKPGLMRTSGNRFVHFHRAV